MTSEQRFIIQDKEITNKNIKNDKCDYILIENRCP